MKIKTFKIKIENDNQTFDVNDFFEQNSTLYDKFAHISEEPDGKYWNVLIFYKTDSLNFYNTKTKEVQLSMEFVEEIESFIDSNPQVATRVLNSIRGNIKQLFAVKDLIGFKRFRNLGNDSLAYESEFLNGVLTIIEKYRN